MAIAAFLPLIGKVLNRVLPDEAAREAATLKLMELEQQGNLAELEADVALATGQLEVNKAEAAHGSIFVAGWRPFIGWICGFALLYSFILLPFMMFGAFLANFDVSAAPKLNTGELMTVLLGMLGLGGMRSYEKRNGVARGAIDESATS